MSQFRIFKHLFTVSDPYRAGQTLGEAEAKALNLLRAENIRNNQAKAFLKLRQPPSEQDLESFAEELQAYDLKYQLFPSLQKESISFPLTAGQEKRREIERDIAHRTIEELEGK